MGAIGRQDGEVCVQCGQCGGHGGEEVFAAVEAQVLGQSAEGPVGLVPPDRGAQRGQDRGAGGGVGGDGEAGDGLGRAVDEPGERGYVFLGTAIAAALIIWLRT